MTCPDHKSATWKLAWASVLVLVTVLALIFTYLHSCGVGPTKHVVVDPAPVVVQPPPPPPPPPVCTKTTFEQVAPLLTARCVSCHFAPDKFDTYPVAKARVDDYLYRVNVLGNSPDRMPRTPAPELSPEDKALLQHWKDDGLLQGASDCSPAPPPPAGFMGLDQVESYILADLNRPGSQAQDLPFTRYLVATHKLNSGATVDLAEAPAAVDKTFNSLNGTLADIVPATPVDPGHTILRVDLRSYGLQTADWTTLLTADRFKVVSQTDKGKQIRTLTGTDQPWLHYDNAVLAANQAQVYYTLLKVSPSFAQFTVDVGAHYAADLLAGTAVLAGFNGSPITEQKNRLLSRHDTVIGGRQSYLWVSYDVAAPVAQATQNLFAFPLLKETGSAKVYTFQASEAIWGLPNGLQGYALYDAAGVRLDAAAQNIVSDNRSPVSTEIRNAASCHRCHEGGLLVAQDQVRGHVLANADQFLRADVDLVSQLYAPANSLSATFARDIKTFAKSLAVVHASPAKDPVTAATDTLQLGWDVKKVAAFVFLSEEQFKAGLNGSAVAKAQVGQLLTGGTITFDQFVQVFPVLEQDLRLFQQPLN